MRKSKFSETQIVEMLKDAESDVPVVDLLQRHGATARRLQVAHQVHRRLGVGHGRAFSTKSRHRRRDCSPQGAAHLIEPRVTSTMTPNGTADARWAAATSPSSASPPNTPSSASTLRPSEPPSSLCVFASGHPRFDSRDHHWPAFLAPGGSGRLPRVPCSTVPLARAPERQWIAFLGPAFSI